MRLMRPARRRGRLFGAVAALAAAAMVLSACSTGDQPAVTVTKTAGSTPVTVPSLSDSVDPSSAGSAADPSTESSSTQPESAQIRVSSTPAFGSKKVAPNQPISLMAFHAELSSVTMTGDDGSQITGKMGEDGKTWKNTDALKYGVTYTVSGEAVAPDGSSKNFDGKLSTVDPKETIRAAIQIPPGATVGIAAPIVLTFFEPVQDKEALADRLHVSINDGQDIKGAWVWMQDEDVQGKGTKWSRVHFRPAKFWPAHAKVHVEADLYGVDYGSGWGREDITRDFEIGPDLQVKASVDSHRLLVLKDGQVIKNYPVSYGKAAVKGRRTVSGVHIVQNKNTDNPDGSFTMCNPKYGYCGVTEYWGVRINNNGEFIHVNKETEKDGLLGKANITHGCINMGMKSGKEFYDMVYYGVPVDVEGTGAEMTEKDYVWDWSKSWDEWKGLSALQGMR